MYVTFPTVAADVSCSFSAVLDITVVTTTAHRNTTTDWSTPGDIPPGQSTPVDRPSRRARRNGWYDNGNTAAIFKRLVAAGTSYYRHKLSILAADDSCCIAAKLSSLMASDAKLAAAANITCS